VNPLTAWRAIFVLGNPAYYTRFGFNVALTYPYQHNYPREHLMALPLYDGALTDTSHGKLIWSPAFDADQQNHLSTNSAAPTSK
jgi:putative acetyltransferase